MPGYSVGGFVGKRDEHHFKRFFSNVATGFMDEREDDLVEEIRDLRRDVLEMISEIGRLRCELELSRILGDPKGEQLSEASRHLLRVMSK